MIITNKTGLPEIFVEAVKKEKYSFKPNSYSATTIIHSPTEVILQRRHDNEIESDCSEMLNMIFGTSVHSWIEKHKTGNELVELYLKKEIIPDLFLSGKLDLFDPSTKELVDWKTGTVYKVLKKDFEDWRKQGLIYAYLLKNEGYEVKRITFWCFLKDWSAREKRQELAKGNEYPETQAYKFTFEVTDEEMKYIDDYINAWFREVALLNRLEDDELPYCGDDNSWFTGDTFAVYRIKKDGTIGARADKLCKSLEEAKAYIDSWSKAFSMKVVERKGEYKKCRDYCSCCNWCKHYKEKVMCNE